MAKVLLVEDDEEIAFSIRDWLSGEQHTVDMVHNGAEGLDLMNNYHYDLVVLDINLPDISGIEVCSTYRSKGGNACVLMLTGNDRIVDKEHGLDAGADDYLTKPFHPRELSARLRALMRRSQRGGKAAATLEFRGIKLDPAAKRVSRDGVEIQLLPKEFALLEFLMRHPGEVFSQDALLERVWSSESEVSPDTVRVHIRRLRQKLGFEGDTLIKTLHRQGYLLVG
ncbi:MAG: response regulator transcription factor [Candidatus Obscuribacterales bacterium]